MAIVICFANMKGGVGKTTLCVNLSFDLFRRRKNVLVVDNDPQFNATSALLPPQMYIDEIIKNKDYLTIYDIYEKPPRIRGTKVEKHNPQKFFITVWHIGKGEFVLDLIASRIELYETLRNPSQKEYLLNNFLQEHAKKYDYIFIDCPPTPSVLNLSAFAASDNVIIPVTPDYYSTMGLPQFLGTLKDFKTDLPDPHKITPLGVVFTNVQRKRSSDTQKSMDLVIEALDESSEKIHVFKNEMSHLKVYQKTLWQSVPVQQISGKGIRGKYEAITELENIARELEDEIKKKKGSGKNGK